MPECVPVRKKGKAMPLKQSTLVQFKEGVGDLVRLAPGYRPDALFNFLVLDAGDGTSRVDFPGYGRPVVRFIPEELPFLGSPVRAVALVPEGCRRTLSGVRPEEAPELPSSDARYCGDVVLMYAEKALPEGFASMDPEGMRGAVGELVREDVRLLDLYGVLPVTLEDVPGIDGCLPEFVNPPSDRSLLGILGKIRRSCVRA